MINKKSWYTYIVRCGDQTLYTGITTDPKKRLAVHNSGRGAKYTRSRLPVSLVHCEEFPSRSAAARREYQIKKMEAGEKQELFDKPENIISRTTA